jgi:hypothetical protein
MIADIKRKMIIITWEKIIFSKDNKWCISIYNEMGLKKNIKLI